MNAQGRALSVTHLGMPEEVTIGMPVRVVFEPLTDDVTLPKFRPA